MRPTLFDMAIFSAALATFSWVGPAFAGQAGTGVFNTNIREHGSVERITVGSGHRQEYVNGQSYSTSLKQECTAQPGSRCAYQGAITSIGGYASQQGVANTDPVSISTMTTTFTQFGSQSSNQSVFVEKYKGTVEVNSHEAGSFARL